LFGNGGLLGDFRDIVIGISIWCLAVYRGSCMYCHLYSLHVVTKSHLEINFFYSLRQTIPIMRSRVKRPVFAGEMRIFQSGEVMPGFVHPLTHHQGLVEILQIAAQGEEKRTR